MRTSHGVTSLIRSPVVCFEIIVTKEKGRRNQLPTALFCFRYLCCTYGRYLGLNSLSTFFTYPRLM
jgi:hypothetical protein